MVYTRQQPSSIEIPTTVDVTVPPEHILRCGEGAVLEVSSG